MGAEVHQPREHPIPCSCCRRPTMAFHGVCEECAPTTPRATCVRCDPQLVVMETVEHWGPNPVIVTREYDKKEF